MFRVICHLDMDAFYASVEQRDTPALRDRPVIVGSPPTQRGVVCAASYEARKFGVRSAMPSATAGRLCPNGVFVRPRMDRYREESRAIMHIGRQARAPSSSKCPLMRLTSTSISQTAVKKTTLMPLCTPHCPWPGN